MNDFDEEIIGMCKDMLSGHVQLNCYVHLERNANKRSLPKELKPEIIADVKYLSESISPEEFQKRWILTKDSWISKNNQDVNDFLD